MKPKVLFFLSVTFLLLLGSASVAFAQSPPPVSFATAVNYPAGAYGYPWQVAVGDFNHDGKLDLVTANMVMYNVSVLLGNGDGTFQPMVNYSTDYGPNSIAVGDFNGDGNLDLATANGIGDVSVFLGNGDGTFQPAVNYPAGNYPQSIAVGDFNGDGKLDLVVTNNEGNNVSVLLGNGDGTFRLPVNSPAGAFPFGIAVADFNGDGNLDVVVTSAYNNFINVLLGNGDGTFQPPVTYYVESAPFSVAVGDFNGDGKLDLAVANVQSASVSVLLGNGDGTFQPAVGYATGTSPYSVAVGDFNGDGKLDLVTANDYATFGFVLLGNGDGTFQPAVSYTADSAPISIAVGDFNGDGKPDLAVANHESGDVSVLLNDTQPPIRELLIPSGGTNAYQFNNNLFNYKVTYPALLSPPTSPVYLAVWPVLISQTDLNARLAGQFPGATLVPYDRTGGYGVLFRAACQDSSGNPATCPHTTGANTFYTSWNSPTGQTISNPAFLMAEIAPVGTQTFTNIFTAYSQTRTDPTVSGRTAPSFSDFVVVQNIGGTPPTITIRTPVDGGVYALYQNVLADYDCGTSPVFRCLGTVPLNSPIDTSSVGSKTFEVNAIVSSGPSADKSVSYTVGYNTNGCLLYDPNRSVKQGAAFPIKLEVCDAAGNNLSSPSIVVHAVSVTMVSGGAPRAPEASGNANPGSDFRFDSTLGVGGGYIFNLKTTGLSSGTWNLNFTITGDPSTHSAMFRVK